MLLQQLQFAFSEKYSYAKNKSFECSNSSFGAKLNSMHFDNIIGHHVI